MRTDLSLSGFGWISKLDYKKVIVAVFLLRLILASAYDIFVTITDRDILLPDSKFYSVRGSHTAYALERFDRTDIKTDMLPRDRFGREIFIETLRQEGVSLPAWSNENGQYFYVIGIIYSIFGHYTIWVRCFNICISLVSVYLLFRVAKTCFGALAANIFLVTALFLPSQFMYSITLSRDFIRVISISAVVWAIYVIIGDLWIKKVRQFFCS